MYALLPLPGCVGEHLVHPARRCAEVFQRYRNGWALASCSGCQWYQLASESGYTLWNLDLKRLAVDWEAVYTGRGKPWRLNSPRRSCPYRSAHDLPSFWRKSGRLFNNLAVTNAIDGVGHWQLIIVYESSF